MPPQAPPIELIQSPFRPFILSFYFRLFVVLSSIPGSFLTSWFRTFDENVRAGGDPQSQHLFALGADLDVPTPQIAQSIDLGRFLGLIPVDEGTHVHFQLFPKGALARAGILFPEA